MASKRMTIREKRRQQMRRQRLVTILIVVGVALVFAAVLIAPSLRTALAPVGDIIIPDPITVPNPVANSMGNPNAPVKVVEYSDFQCPACQVFFQQTEPRFVQEYVETGQVYFTYRSMGVWIGPESAKAAEAAYCAGDQNRFWDYHNILFANQGGENVGVYSDKRLVAFADALGLDMGQFEACFDSGKYSNQVAQDQVDGRAAGVTGTPSFVINGKMVGGAIPFSTMQQEIEAALASSQ